MFSGAIATTTSCAAAAMAVFATGFAVYALAEPSLGPAGASAVVAAVGALIVAILALVAHLRAKAREEEASQAQAALMDSMPLGLGSIAKDHPIAAILATIVGGAIAARHPKLTRDLISLAARFTGR